METGTKINPLATNPVAHMYARTQRITLDALGDAIHRGGAAGLEPLVWTVGFEGATGEVNNITHGTEKARALFDAWMDVLGARKVRDFEPNEHGDCGSTAQVDGPVKLVLRLELSGYVIAEEKAGQA